MTLAERGNDPSGRTSVFVNAVGTATPMQRYTKADCWRAFAESDWFNRLEPRALAVARAVLTRDNGIEARHLALDSLDEVFTIDADVLHTRFATHAPALALLAGRRALEQCGLPAHSIDAIVVSTCTGYLCPGLSGYVAEALGLRPDIGAYDLVGQGCAAALPNWQVAEGLVASGRARHVLSVCVEVSSAAMYLDNDPGVLISACLFGDGAGAAVLSSEPLPRQRPLQVMTTASRLAPEAREALRFQSRGGLLRNVLTRHVPQLAAQHASKLLDETLQPAGLRRDDIAAWIVHSGGRDVLLAVQDAFGVPADALAFSAAILREYGNLSSATVYFVLAAALAQQAPAGWWWMTSFGAGFSCHGALLRAQ
jgi:alkylresorcinol/alkylpyrone synthase